MAYRRILIRRDTAANWTANNPTLAAGEFGHETDTGKLKLGDGSTAWTSLGYQSNVTSVNGSTGAVTGLAPLASPTFTGTPTLPTGTIATTQTASNNSTAIATTAYVDAADALKANLASPTFTGTPTLPTGTIATTQSVADNSTKVATTAFVRGEVTALVNSATATLDTLGEIATALGNDANLSTTLTTSIGLKAPLASPTFTGTVTLPNSTVTNEMLASDSVTQAKIADRAVGSAELDNLTLNAQTGTTYTLVLADAHKLVTLSNASGITLTIPTNSSVAFDIGDQVSIVQLGAGQVTVGGAGVTLRSQGSKLKLNGIYSAATLLKINTDEWVLVGNTAA